MNDNMILLGGKPPSGNGNDGNDEMPSGRMDSAQGSAPGEMQSSGEMPSGNMNMEMGAMNMADAGGMDSGRGDMPAGGMAGMGGSAGNQMEPSQQMPVGNMNEASLQLSMQPSDTGRQMPTGSMMQGSASLNQEANYKTIELAGSWKLQFTVN